MKRVSITSALILLTLLLTAQPARAQEVVSFQGRLTGPDGAPVADDTYSVRFQLFEAPTGGSAQWGESHTVETTGGVFSVLLGMETLLDLDAFHETPYLALTIDGQPLAPRTPLTAVPYAMKSYRLDEAALRAGQNVSINRLSDGTLQIGATGGGTGGLTSVATDGTIEGNGTSGSPLGIADGSVTGEKLSNNALLAGANVDIVRRGNGSWEISSTGDGGLSAVTSDGTLTGDGTAGSPLQVADGAVTGVKLADDALVAGANVTITRQAGGALEVTAAGGGGLSAVTSDATLTGDGTAGSPLMVAAPLHLIGTGSAIVRAEATDGSFGTLGGSQGAAGVYGESGDGNRSGSIGSSTAGVSGFYAGTSSGHLGGSGFGVSGIHDNGNRGGLATTNYGVYGYHVGGNDGYIGGSSYAVYGEHSNGNWGGLGNSTYGVWGSGASSGFAGFFDGSVTILGNLAKSSGSFRIDHPLDPANKYLSHSFVESPDMMNVYNGNVTTDANGEAVVTLPDYFEALNRDFRYQLTVIGTFAQAIVAEEIQGNQFVIRTDQPHVKVSWLVTGIRQDAWANEHRIVVEEDKPASEQGFYLNPTVFGQPQERRVEWARRPEQRELDAAPVHLEAEGLHRAQERQ